MVSVWTTGQCFIGKDGKDLSQDGMDQIKSIHDTKLSAFSALMLLVGWQEGHPACKN